MPCFSTLTLPRNKTNLQTANHADYQVLSLIQIFRKGDVHVGIIDAMAACYLARYDTDDMIEYLEAWCPDYQGLLINLYEPIHEGFADSRYRNGAC